MSTSLATEVYTDLREDIPYSSTNITSSTPKSKGVWKPSYSSLKYHTNKEKEPALTSRIKSTSESMPVHPLDNDPTSSKSSQYGSTKKGNNKSLIKSHETSLFSSKH